MVVGRKSRIESFAGADCTYTIEAMMGDGKALQAGTSHNLGQNFARAFNTKFLKEDGKEEFVWQSSWGVSTRMVGGVIMCHGDDTGLRLPPALAPLQARSEEPPSWPAARPSLSATPQATLAPLLTKPASSSPPLIPSLPQVIVVPIWKKPEEKEAVLAAADSVVAAAAKAGVRAKVDATEQRTPGWKYNHWEMKAREERETNRTTRGS